MRTWNATGRGAIVIAALAVVLLVLACATAEPGAKVGLSRADNRAIDKIMGEWQEALTSEDVDRLMRAYWADATLAMIMPDGDAVFQGAGEIAEFQRQGFENSDQYAEMEIEQRPIVTPEGQPVRLYAVSGPGFTMLNRFHYELRDGEWRVLRQEIEAE